MKKASALLFLFVGLLILPACIAEEDKTKPSEKPTPAVTKNGFQKLTLETALKHAKKQEKVVMVDFTATWCGPCKMLDKNTFSQKNVQSWLKKNTVAIKIDVDKNRDLAKKYKIRGIPCMVFVDPEGEEVGRVVGYRNADGFLTAVKKALKKD